MISILCAIFVCPLEGCAESTPEITDTLYSLSTRTFDLGIRSPFIESGVENGFISFIEIPWIKDMTWSDPLLARTAIFIKDRTPPPIAGAQPGWLPDTESNFHPDPTLPPIFDLDGYEVGWRGRHEAPVRGDILIFPSKDPQRFFVLCAYDRSEPKPTLCSVTFRYEPDRILFVETRIFWVTSPLNDFAEIVARVDALVRCLDVTEAVRAGEPDLGSPVLQTQDIAAGGRCRLLTSS